MSMTPTHVRKKSSEAQMILESSGMNAIAAYSVCKPFLMLMQRLSNTFHYQY